MAKIKGSTDLEQEVIKQRLCVSCGACVGLCGYFGTFHGRVVMLDNCGLSDGRCYEYCPMTETDKEKIRAQFFEENDYLPEIGLYRDLYMTRAVDDKIRAKSQHGGTVTALMKLAIEEGFIDAAVLTRSDGGLNPKGTLVSIPEDVENCSGSSFQMSPTLSILNQALKDNKYKKIGVVGTPCKTLAVYKMKSKLIENNDKNADKIALVVGLFCGWGLDWKGVDRIIRNKVTLDNVVHIDIPPSKYKAMQIKTKENDIEIPLEEIYPIINESCSYCDDFTAEFSDLSVGGARSSKGWDYDRGWNQVIVRTKKGEELLKIAKEKKVLEFEKVESQSLDKLKKAHSNKRNNAVRNIDMKSSIEK
jgi:coenzyme F420 hydrogenase subunit beta